MVGDPAESLPGTGFAVVRRGYDQAEVEEHLRRLDAQIRILVHDRAAAADQSDQLARELDETRARTERLRAQVRTLVSPPQSVQGMSERMRSMLRLAEDEVAEMVGRADAEVERRVREAEQRAAQIVSAAQDEADATRAGLLADTERAVREFAQERDAVAQERRAATAELADAAAMAEQERAQALAESESRRALVEEDFTLAMNQRRSQALTALTVERLDTRRAIEERRESAAATARATVEDAQLRARGILADAERRIVELTALRRRILEQLGSTRAVLERGVGGLEPLPEELDGAPRHRAGSTEPDGSPADAVAAGTGGQHLEAAEPSPTDREGANGTGRSPSPRRRDDWTKAEAMPR